MSGLKSSAKPFEISKWEVWQAYQKVKANKGAPGVDGVDLAAFEEDLQNNLFKIWNRMSSGSYFPPPVRAVEIPKPHGGGTRILGVPTVGDRIAQTVVAGRLQEKGRTDLSSRLLRLPAGAISVGCGSDMPGALLGIRLGHRPGCSEVFRQRLVGSSRQSGRRAHRPAVGVAVCEAVARRPHAAARWRPGATRSWNPTGISDLTRVSEPVSALCVRCVDGPELPGHPVRTFRGRRRRALHQPATR